MMPGGPTMTFSRLLTARSVVIGLIASAVMAVIAPLNDWALGNTPIYNHYLPLGVTVLVLLMGLVVNPLLGERRLRSGEMTVIVSMLLVLGGVASSGLTRLLPGVMAGPARVLPAEPGLSPFLGNGELLMPRRVFVDLPDHGPPDPNDPDHRLVVDGFHNGLPQGAPVVGHRATVTWSLADGSERTALALAGKRAAEMPGCLDLDHLPGLALLGHHVGDTIATAGGPLRIVAVVPPAVPWRAWWRPYLAWLPLLLGAFIACLAISALVRRQWIDHERLPFPLANVTLDFMAPPEPGTRLAPIFRARGFWLGFVVVAVVLVSQGLETWGLLPMSVSTTFDFRDAFASEPWYQVYTHWALFRVNVYFSIVGLAFFLPLDLSFSLWFFFVATNLVYMVLKTQGRPVAYDDAGKVGVGGFAVECLLILWIGRRHYLGLLRAAFSRGGDEHQRLLVPYVWMLLGGVLTMAMWLVALGAQPHHALVAVLLFLGFVLVLARVVAEAGIPAIGLPAGCHLSQVLFSVVGFGAPLAALAPLTLLGATLLGNSRENLLPYAVDSEYLVKRTLIQNTVAKRLRWTGLLIGVLVLGSLAAMMTLVSSDYQRDGQVDRAWYSTLVEQGLMPLATGSASGAGAQPGTWSCYGLGAVLVGVLGVCRMFLSWWPLHPIGYLVSMTGPTQAIWFSFLLAWMAKLLVTRYGGPQLYQRLKPVAMGLIAAEAATAGLFMLLAAVLHWCGIDFPRHVSFLPL